MKILAALDLSTKAPAVLEKAVAMAKQEGADLTLLSVSEDFSDIGDFTESGNIREKLLAQTKKNVEDFVAQAKVLGVSARGVAEAGVSPADIIVAYAQDNKIDTIVMGNRSKTGFERFLIGSVASKVVAHAPCSVLVIR